MPLPNIPHPVIRILQTLWRSEYARVKRVIDGDTIVLHDGRRVRYIGMDAPELRSRKRKRAQAYANLARARNRQLVEGKRVRLVRDQRDTDRYNRLLRYVYVGTIHVNALLVKEGLARPLRVAPNTQHAPHFVQAEKYARRHRRGLWKR